MLPEAEFFDADDLRCHDGTPYPVEWDGTYTILVLKTADPVRRLWGGPLIVISGYRTKEWNAHLIEQDAGRHHVASGSYHMSGEALDLAPQDATPPMVYELHNRVLEAYRVRQLPYLGGLGLYDHWIHVDIHKAPDGHLRRWDMRSEAGRQAVA